METIVFDIETNGLGHYEPVEILQIAALRVESGQTFQAVIDPGTARFEAGAYKLHLSKGRSPAWFKRNGKVPLVAMMEFRDFCGDEKVILAGHNVIEFDLPHVVSSLKVLGIESLPDYEVLDTLVESERLKVRGKIPNRRLATVAKYYGVQVVNAHDAMGDVRTTASIIEAMRKEVR